ncbi:Anthocyanin 5-aromatic acyltransferase-like protein [Heracleum sosnowskyi]|uniref:Anthocyanin 5-aromatic acyltransferase-like protein n=1 Tax=Heracleum sosnowskyi TaxID=360622 RepID=A0AAD8HA17_9APIA|nr:Anthocyanin 5-aromatic acyltransferase-like protein [Heracleum sosnowskyi]
MAPSFKIKIVDECQVSPPPNTTPISLPLTFLDIPWLLFSPNQSIFFYKFSNYTCNSTTIIPFLKHSLSLTLQHFSPFSGDISTPSRPVKPQIMYSHGDYVLLTIAESDGDAFSQLSCNCPKDVSKLLALVPNLESPVSNETTSVPSLAVQVTVFGDMGISIGLSLQHVVSDERTYNIFMKTIVCEKVSTHTVPMRKIFDNLHFSSSCDHNCN